MNLDRLNFSIPTLSQAYQNGVTVDAVLEEVRRRVSLAGDNPIWIHLLSNEDLGSYVERLREVKPSTLPLYGIPFAIKDNIDLAGVRTTAACEAFSYTPSESAFVVERLISAGAVPIGKTNLDQFATGLVGTRSPWGAVRNSFDSGYIAGGSSAGSAVSVALGQVSFALGTDTAGSGRIPAAFNNLVGFKPTRGLLSTRGVVPACRTLDCISIFGLTVADTKRIFDAALAFDGQDPYARPPTAICESIATVGIPLPNQLDFEGNNEYREAFARATAKLPFEISTIDINPLLEAGKLLYEGAWVAERYHAARTLIQDAPDSLRPEFREIMATASDQSAVDYFDGAYRLASLRRVTESMLAGVDAFLLPTAPTHYMISQISADPIRKNAVLGRFTNFMNLLDLCGIAIPAGTLTNGCPFGITLAADRQRDGALLSAAQKILCRSPRQLGATGVITSEPLLLPAPCETIAIAVCGAHLTGMPLNSQLRERGAHLREQTRSAPHYHLYALPGGPPFRPGMVRSEQTGASIELEVFDMPSVHLGSFLQGVTAPLGLGKIELESGEWVTGFICEPHGINDAEDITRFGSWRAYIQSLKS